MAGIAGKYASAKVQKYMKHKVGGSDDPFKEEINLPNGKKEKVWREIPDFIPAHDAQILDSVRNRAYKADMGAGGHFGWEGIIGFILPEIGDIIGVVYSLWFIFRKCRKVEGGLPKEIQHEMLTNIVIDLCVGAIPFVGDIFDMFWRCNTKNVRLLEKHLRTKYGPADKQQRHSAGLRIFGRDKQYMEKLQTAGASPSSHDWDDLDGDSVAAAHRSDNRWAPQVGRAGTQRPAAQHVPGTQQYRQEPRMQAAQSGPRPPQQQQRPQTRQPAAWGSMFGRGKERPVDPEMGRMGNMRGGTPVVAQQA